MNPKHVRISAPQTAEILRLKADYAARTAPWQRRHEEEIRSQVRFVECRYRDTPVMRKEDL